MHGEKDYLLLSLRNVAIIWFSEFGEESVKKYKGFGHVLLNLHNFKPRRLCDKRYK